MSNCLLSGLPDDPLVDAEIWRYVLTLGTPGPNGAPGTPFDLSGSDLTIVMRTIGGWEIVSTLSTVSGWPDTDGTLTIADDPKTGVVTIASDPWMRTYRVPVPRQWIGAPPQAQVQGDVLRLTKTAPAARPEYLGYIRFPLRASTTQWPAPTF